MSKRVSPREDAGASPEEKTMDEAKREFLARAIPFMLAKFYKAEQYGVNWRTCKLEQLDDLIFLAEEFAKAGVEVCE